MNIDCWIEICKYINICDLSLSIKFVCRNAYCAANDKIQEKRNANLPPVIDIEYIKAYVEAFSLERTFVNSMAEIMNDGWSYGIASHPKWKINTEIQNRVFDFEDSLLEYVEFG